MGAGLRVETGQRVAMTVIVPVRLVPVIVRFVEERDMVVGVAAVRQKQHHLELVRLRNGVGRDKAAGARRESEDLRRAVAPDRAHRDRGSVRHRAQGCVLEEQPELRHHAILEDAELDDAVAGVDDPAVVRPTAAE